MTDQEATVQHERLLYVPNETETSSQVGPRDVFQRWLGSGRLEALHVRPFRASGDADHAAELVDDLLRLGRELDPSVILWEHPGGLPLAPAGLRALRRVAPGATLIYREGDAYGLLRKRLPRGALQLAKVADVVFVPGLGSLQRLFRMRASASVGWAPSVADTIRFGSPWEPAAERPFDVVLIGSRHPRRNRFSGLPGARRRSEFAERLSAVLGPRRFGLFGSGWDGLPGARGPLPFAAQEHVSRDAWLTVSWDHFDRLPYFFSNRLPISLLSGVAHLTNRHPGYDELFTDGGELFLADGVDDAVSRVESLLSGPRETLEEVGARGARYARTMLTTGVVYERMVEAAVAWRDHRTPLPRPDRWRAGALPVREG